MPRPNIVRADTLDLQNHETPAAQDHTEVRTVNGYGASQSQAIRSAAEDQAQAQGHHHRQMGKQEEDELERELADAEVAGDEGGFDDDDLMDKMSSSPSIVDEDIDFEMVYALHTFNASVEGQANAAKGEHMVLLDDSNSYWWLVRIVRDSSIGYLPAEHIETPMERLARLNKHRNIDLAANMLSDNVSEKSKNPIKKAMRRRNMKSVAFTSPTYFSASEYECTTDEEGEEYFDEDGEQAAEEADEAETTSTTAVAGKKTNGTAAAAKDDKSSRLAVNGITPSEHGAEVRSSSDIRTSEDASKHRANPADPLTYHDERQGTKKLTLTPGILRDDVRTGSPTKDVGKARPSLDRKDPQSQPKREDAVTSPPPREGKKLKKGSRVLGNLFKKRSKKGRKEEGEDVEEWLHSTEKPSIDSSRSSESSGRDRQGSQSSRLDVDISKRDAEDFQKAEEQKRQQEKQQQQERQRLQMQQQQREQELQRQKAQQQQQQKQQQQQSNPINRVDSDENKPSPISQKGSTPIDISPNSSTLQQGTLVRSPVESKKSPEQEFRPQARDERPVDRRGPQGRPQQEQSMARKMFEDKPNVYQPQQQHHGIGERLSESPEHITYHDATDRPDLLVDTSSGHETSSPIDSSPELIDSRFENQTSPAATITPAPVEHLGGHTITRTWSDWSLKTYLDDDNDVRDMLIVVQQDKGEAIHPKSHPEIMPLFENSSRRLADITQQLDGMLGEWLQRRAAAT